MEGRLRGWMAGVAVVLMAAGPVGAESCGSCHVKGAVGMGQVVGRPAEDILRMMEAYRAPGQAGTLMGRIVRGFSPSEVRDLSTWFSKQ